MATYYSASKRGFFDSGLHGTLPTDAVAVTDTQHADLLSAQATGQVIAPDANGNPVASVRVPTLAQALSALAALYASKQCLGVLFQASGVTAPSVFPSDNNGQLKLVSAYTMAQAGLWADGTPWISVTGVSVPMVKADILALAPRVAAYVAACTARYGALIPLVAADVATDTSGGWPDNA